MSLWVSLHRIERKPFLTLPDFLVANYHEAKEHVLSKLEGVDELDDFPSESEIRRYIGKETGENKQGYYERALQHLPELKEYYLKYKPVSLVLSKEQDYLDDYANYEELFFLKRCYELADDLKEQFSHKFNESDGMAIVLSADDLSRFNELTGQSIACEEGYIYKLFVG